MNPMPPCTCTPSEATSLPMSVEKALATGVSSEARWSPALRAASSFPRCARSIAAPVASQMARAERAVVVDKKLRDQKERNAFRARRRIRQPREHEMNDVVGEVMLAIGDEDL